VARFAQNLDAASVRGAIVRTYGVTRFQKIGTLNCVCCREPKENKYDVEKVLSSTKFNVPKTRKP